MKLSGGVLLAALCSTATAASHLGRLFLYDAASGKPAPHQTPASLSPEAARLILAQRLGVSQYHTIGENVYDEVAGIVNAKGRAQGFFGLGLQDRSDARVLVWIEGVDDAQDIIKDATEYEAFDMTNPPSAADNSRLIQDLVKQAEALPKKPDPQGLVYNAAIESEAAFNGAGKATTYNDFLTVFRVDAADKASFADISDALDRLLHKIDSSLGRGWALNAVTVVLTPSNAKSAAARPYGSYQVPSTLEARREPPEQFMSLSSVQPSSEPQISHPADLEDFPTIQQEKSNDTSPILGILPPNFESMEECQRMTNSCSGHGKCITLRRTGAKNDRYVCACKPTVEHVGQDEGMERPKTKTTYWGGPACQKKDISQPFWLFVATGVILAGLISAGIGMLFSMGNEELPSVIGAGVSGPVRK